MLGNGKRWTYPTRGDCATCHTEAANDALGPELKQFAGQAIPAGAQEMSDDSVGQSTDFVSWLVNHEYFYPEYTDPGELEERTGRALVEPGDDSAPMADRARSYLHSNCSGCHRDGGTGRVGIDLKYGSSIDEAAFCDKEVERGSGTLSRDDFRVVDPGDPENSAVYMRMMARDFFQMPPLATHEVDEAGTGVVHDWIEAMDESCRVD
jgi:mono/diheme cytochrome c family protein